MCGGTIAHDWSERDFHGLSPRVRGNPLPIAPIPRRPGSIPACAGEPQRNLMAARLLEVYPRVCGGTDLGQAMLRDAEGLSPRVRGNHIVPLPERISWWSIPACAGEPVLPLARPP